MTDGMKGSSYAREVTIWKCRLGRRTFWFERESQLDEFILDRREEGLRPAAAGYVIFDRRKHKLVEFLNEMSSQT